MEGEQWRAFKQDTEAGRLLARLYGVEAGSNKPKVSYPKLKPKQKGRENGESNLQHKTQWRSVGAPNTRDPTEKRYDRAKAAAVPVPKFGRNKGKRKAEVDIIPRRRPAASCKVEIDHGKQNKKAYRPPRQNAVYTDAEKDKLNEINTYRGGRILPTDLTHPVAPMPSEIKQKQQEAERVREARTRRKFRVKGSSSRDADVGGLIDVRPKSSKDILFDQIVEEIKDRRKFQLEMERCQAGGQSREKIVNEISARAKELYRLDKERAEKILQADF